MIPQTAIQIGTLTASKLIPTGFIKYIKCNLMRK